MLIPKIVARNLVAHRQKNKIIFFVVAIICLFLFLLLSFSDGELSNIKSALSGFYFPSFDIRVDNPSIFYSTDESSAADKTIKDSEATLKALKELPSVKDAVRKLWGLTLGLYSKGKKYLNLACYPLAPEDSSLRSKYTIVEGSDIAPNTTGQMLVHYSIAQRLPIKVGDEVVAVCKNYFGQMSSLRVKIAGFFEPVFDNPNLSDIVLLPLSDLAMLGGFAKDEVQYMLITLKPGVDIEAALEELEDWFVKNETVYTLRTWREIYDGSGNYQIFEMVRLMLLIVVLVTLFVTAFGVMNVVAANLFQRKKEIATYYCLGVERRFLKVVYTLEIFIVNLFGALSGVGAGLLARLFVNALNITSRDPGFQYVAGSNHFTLGLSESTILWILGGVCLVTLLTAITTLGKALRVSPVEAVRETE